MKLKSILAAAILCQASLPVLACGYDEIFNNPFALGHTGSIGVALQTQQALEKGQINRVPSLTSEESLERAETWLDQLRGRLETAELPNKFSVYLTDAGLWARFDVRNNSVSMEAHTTPEENETVLVISEAALSALLNKQISAVDAEKMGLLRWSASANPQVTAALSNATQS